MALTPRQQTLIDALAGGPKTRAELVRHCGYEDNERGKNYVHVNVMRLARRGYRIHAIGRQGSHRGVLYVLLATTEPETDGVHCVRCGTALAADHRGAVTCSPCERALMALELAAS